jgi:hypothetical protein
MTALSLTPLWSFIAWHVKDHKTAHIITLDKTVPSERRKEHIAWFWVLNHFKYFKEDGTRYRVKNDYLGFFPNKTDTLAFSIKDLDGLSPESISRLSDSTDLFYIADTYGVYEHEWLEIDSRPNVSKKVYGGATINDYLLAKAMLDNGNTVIAESNLLAPPTSWKVRERFEDLFKVSWSGWVGKYYPSMDTTRNNEIPLWVTELYHEQYGDDWPFESGGIVLVNSDTRIIILDAVSDLEENTPMIITDEAKANMYGVKQKVPYPFWFEITFPAPGDSVEVTSWFELKCTSRGDSLLNANDVLKRFPAVMKGKYANYYYMTGDFADNNVKFSNSYFRGITYMRHFFFLLDEESQREEFFWQFYAPMMKYILEDSI